MSNSHEVKVSDRSFMDSPSILTLEQMKERYWGEWLLIDLAELDENMNVKQGRVLFHSADQQEVYDSIHLREGRAASIEHLGSILDDYAVMF